jgi:uncharacterized protein YmfQ (DUF2313 family)
MGTSEQYRKAIHQIAPMGLTWPGVSEDSNIGKIWETIGDALLCAEVAADTLLNDSFPDSAGNFLSDWERVLGLPRSGITGQTAQERRDTVLAWLNISPYSNKQFYVDIALVMGFVITVEDRNDDPTLGAFEWRVNASADFPPVYFRTGESRVGEPLLNAGSIEALESLIEFFSPAHTTVAFNYLSNLVTISGDNLVTIGNDNIVV